LVGGIYPVIICACVMEDEFQDDRDKKKKKGKKRRVLAFVL
jgi:hypothetical protein